MLKYTFSGRYAKIPKMVEDVAQAFGVDTYSLEEITASINRKIAMEGAVGFGLLPIFFGLGWLRGETSHTKTIEDGIISYFKDHSPFTG
jgi:hypothetical protein